MNRGDSLRTRSRKKKSYDFEFIGLKKYTHDQRTKIIKKIVVPILKKELKKNLIAIAADGSYARNEDVDFSDIELIIFVKNKNNLPRGFGKIINGVLVEGMFMTVGDFYREVLDVNDEWYISGSDRLKAITNPSFIEKVKKYNVHDLSDKCFEFSKKALFENQECFGKLFNAIKKKNEENIFPVLMYVVMQVLKIMSFINKTPYKTLGSFITQAKEFKIKPEGFDEFIELIVNGKYTNLGILEVRSKRLFVGIEQFFMRKMGRDIYDSDLSSICKK
jgi:hypothetical protein